MCPECERGWLLAGGKGRGRWKEERGFRKRWYGNVGGTGGVLVQEKGTEGGLTLTGGANG